MVAGSRLLVAVAIALAIAALPAEAQINQVDQIRDALKPPSTMSQVGSGMLPSGFCCHSS